MMGAIEDPSMSAVGRWSAQICLTVLMRMHGDVVVTTGIYRMG